MGKKEEFRSLISQEKYPESMVTCKHFRPDKGYYNLISSL